MEGFWFFFILSMVVLGGVKFVGWLSRTTQDVSNQLAANRNAQFAEKERIRSESERRAIQLMLEFPTLEDYEVAQLMHDELMNRRAAQEWFQWATTETVGRMRRTLLVEIARQRRAEDENKLTG